jgi:hypothetical protein
MKSVFTTACAALLFFVAALAQNATGRISGTVTDTSGAVVPRAAVTITNQDTRLTWKAITDHAGYYVVTSLPVGAYNVQVQAPGMRKAEQTGYDLADAASISADFKLEVGAVTETVTVTMHGESVNTVSGELAYTIDSEQVQDLALNGRNYMELVTLMPGVVVTSLDQMATTTSLSVTNQSINGNRSDTNHLAVDGGMNLDSGSNSSQVNNVGVDFIQQVRVQTSAFSAQYGRNSGANINVITKGGGQRYHGSLFEVIRNDFLDAKDYFAPVKPELRFNDYGWNIGGPLAIGHLLKGKIFFFVGQEWKRIHHFTGPSRQTLPTLAELHGDFSDRTNTIFFPGTKTPIPDKNLAGLMTPDGIAIMNVYAAMIKYASVYSNTPTTNNATFQAFNPFNWRQDIARLDWRPADKHSLYFRYLHDNYNTIDPYGSFGSSALPTTPTLRDRPGFGPQIGYLWTANPHMLNEAKLNTSWHSQRTPLQGTNWLRSSYGFQFPRAFGGNGPWGDGIPNVTISGFASFNGPATVFLLAPTTDISAADNFTYIKGRHTMTAGALVVRNRKDQNGRTVYDGSVAFNPSGNTNTSNYSLADAALGQFQTYTEADGDPVGFYRFTQYEGYVQDSWKVTGRLSIEVGLRYSHSIPTYTQGNSISNFVAALYDPAQAVTVTPAGLIVVGSGNRYNGIIRAGNGVPADQVGRIPGATSPAVLAIPTGAPRGLYPSANLWMPRFSFAWSPFRNNKTAVRGGFGSFHDRPEGNLIFSQGNLPPWSAQVQYQNANLSNPSGGSVPAAAPLGGISALDPNLKVPVVYTFNFGIQHELPHGMLLDVAYAGNLGRHLLRQPNINNPSFAALEANQAIPSASRPVTNSIVPYKGFSNINMFLSDSNSNYNALQARATKRKGNSIFTLNYTWSHALSDTPGNYNSTGDVIEWADRHFNYGPTSFDRRHIFVATYTYRLPLLRNERGFVRGPLGGWELSGVTRVQTGQYLTPVGSSSIPGTRRAEYLGGPVDLPSDVRGVNKWFNTKAFTSAPGAALGNAGVGIIEGPGWQVWDISLRKVFKINEQWAVRFQADAFDLFNHPNFNNPAVTTSNSDFGTITSSQPARNIQFGARVTF